MEKKRNQARRPNPPEKRGKADTQDVLGAPTRPPRRSPKWQKHHRHLTGLRAHFLRQKGKLTQDANDESPTYSEHMADAGTDSYDRDFALSMLSSDQNALYEIEEALRRIETGTYGICELTGKPISARRLEAIPWARFAVEAEEQLERQGGGVHRAHLGRRGSITEAASAEEGDAGEVHPPANAET